MIIAIVLSAVTAMTVNAVSRSWVSVFGNTEEIANAAEAPQIATAPAVKMPNGRLKPAARALNTPNRMVSVTAPITMITEVVPSFMISPMVICAPRSPTATRRMRLEANSMPATHAPSCERK